MAKTKLCPFSHRLCSECPYHRGRHFDLGLRKKYGGYVVESDGSIAPGGCYHSGELKDWKDCVESWKNNGHRLRTGTEVKLKVTNVDTKTFIICDLEEAKTWNYANPGKIRMIKGLEITSWDGLTKIISHKISRGHQEMIEINEIPY